MVGHAFMRGYRETPGSFLWPEHNLHSVLHLIYPLSWECIPQLFRALRSVQQTAAMHILLVFDHASNLMHGMRLVVVRVNVDQREWRRKAETSKPPNITS